MIALHASQYDNKYVLNINIDQIQMNKIYILLQKVRAQQENATTIKHHFKNKHRNKI